MEWFEHYLADIARYRAYQPEIPVLALLGMHQGLWALLQYRIARAIYRSGLPALPKKLLLAVMVAWQKLIEVLAGISIPYRADIAPGLYIAHFGNIFIGEDVVIGPMCNIGQGVTIGVSGRGDRRGSPVLGRRIYVAANAVVAGRLSVGDGAVIGGNALVTRDVPAGAVMLGNPAKVVSYGGSGSYIDGETGCIDTAAA